MSRVPVVMCALGWAALAVAARGQERAATPQLPAALQAVGAGAGDVLTTRHAREVRGTHYGFSSFMYMYSMYGTYGDMTGWGSAGTMYGGGGGYGAYGPMHSAPDPMGSGGPSGPSDAGGSGGGPGGAMSPGPGGYGYGYGNHWMSPGNHWMSTPAAPHFGGLGPHMPLGIWGMH